MPIAFQCKCGHDYNIAEVNAGRTIRCLGCKRLIQVPATTDPSPAAIQVRRPALQPPSDPAVSHLDLDPASEVPSMKREFCLTDKALIGGSCLMAAGFLWYFIGYRWFGGERLYPTGALIVIGLSFMVRNIGRDMTR